MTNKKKKLSPKERQEKIAEIKALLAKMDEEDLLEMKKLFMEFRIERRMAMISPDGQLIETSGPIGGGAAIEDE